MHFHPDFITFDCYGTLIDWEAGIRAAFAHAARERGVPFDAAKVLQSYVETEAQVEHEGYRAYRDVLAETAQRITERLAWPSGSSGFLADSLPSWRPFADTNRALEELVRRGVRLGILSNVDHDLLAETHRHFTVEFELIVTAQDVRSYKPAHGHFRAARQHIGNQQWLHAAQSHFHDVVPCVELGIPVVWVNRGHQLRREPAPTAEVPDLVSLVSWLEL